MRAAKLFRPCPASRPISALSGGTYGISRKPLMSWAGYPRGQTRTRDSGRELLGEPSSEHCGAWKRRGSAKDESVCRTVATLPLRKSCMALAAELAGLEIDWQETDPERVLVGA